MSDQETFLLRVLGLFARYDECDSLRWTVSDGNASFYVNCNDVFFWGCADVENITPETIDVMEQAFIDCKAACNVTGAIYAGSLYAARVRKMRPQCACYESYPKELWPLFDACGPEREVGPGNPKKRP